MIFITEYIRIDRKHILFLKQNEIFCKRQLQKTLQSAKWYCTIPKTPKAIFNVMACFPFGVLSQQ